MQSVILISTTSIRTIVTGLRMIRIKHKFHKRKNGNWLTDFPVFSQNKNYEKDSLTEIQFPTVASLHNNDYFILIIL
jgi:hypothetical protein